MIYQILNLIYFYNPSCSVIATLIKSLHKKQFDIWVILKRSFQNFQKFNLALLSYFLIDFDLVFGKMRETLRKNKPYQKNLALVTIFIRYIAKTTKKRQKMAIFGQAEKGSHTLEPSFSAII